MNAPDSLPPGTAGYTMIEALTVLVLIAIVLTLAVPNMTAYVGRSKARSALDQVAGDIAYARVLAVRDGRPTALEFSGSEYVIRQVSAPAGAVVKRVRLAREYAGVAVAAPTLTFDARGLLREAGNGRVVVTAGQSRDSMLITVTGRVYRAY